MKQILISVLILFYGSSVFSQGINFEKTTFDEALAKAKQENKMVFMDCYTTWCGPCKRLANDIFTLEEVGSFYNDHFINLKMDMESDEGKNLLKKYQVKAFPTLLWLDSKGRMQHRVVGGGKAKKILDAAVLAMDSTNNWNAIAQRYEDGDRSLTFLRKYLAQASKAGADAKEATEQIFNQCKPEELINADDYNLITSVAKTSSSPVFHFILKNKKEFYAVVDKVIVDQYIETVLMNELTVVSRKGTAEELALKEKEIVELDSYLGAKILARMELAKVRELGDRQKYMVASVDYALEYEMNSWMILYMNAVGVVMSQQKVSEDLLNKAITIIKRSVELETKFFNTDVYAQLLHKAGRSEEAKQVAAKSIALASEEDRKTLWSVSYLNEELK
ncbi:thioredoxin family protein [Marinifilum fragile]|uniref:thioredoxin family protein n=1 Tax=Marinifilum fragile TaxID=570161 RepID=UPI0006D15C3A|nr:thioredoxin family protein [Marinifilum fragile]